MSDVEAINLKAYFNKGGEELDFTGKRCVLAVSVGQEYHEEQKLSSTVHLINKSGFSRVKVVVADTLQRHNKHGKSPGRRFPPRSATAMPGWRATASTWPAWKRR